MTNISAFKIHPGGEKDPQFAVMVADGMASMVDAQQKNDSAQKLFALSGALIMSSGSMGAARDIYQDLKKSKVSGPSAVSNAIIDISARNKLPAQVPLDFIVSGYEEGKARIFYVSATGFNPYAPDKSHPSNRGIAEQEFYAFSGSGAQFATRVINGQIDLGLDPRPRDLVSGLSLMKTVARAATTDAGVNDRLQYGIITPKGMHLLFHPSIDMNGNEEFKDYLSRLLNFEYQEIGEFGTEKQFEARRYNKPARILCRDLYQAFDSDLSELGISSRDFRTVCEMFKESKTSLGKVQMQKKKYRSAKEIAERAVAALMSGDKNQVIEYVVDERKRREAFYSK